MPQRATMKKLISASCLMLMGLSLQVGAYDEYDLKKLLEHNECEKCDLKGANLWGQNLTGANLAEADLTRANLQEANLTRADLSKAKLKDAEYFFTVETAGAKFCKTIMPDGSSNNSGC